MNLRDLIASKSRKGDWRALPASETPEERIVTLGWLCMTATLLAAILLAAYAAI